MNITEIREEIERRGWSQADLAERIGKTPAYVRALLTGAKPLSESTEKHIALLLERERVAVHPFIYTVSLPAAIVHDCLPTWEAMAQDERHAALIGIVVKALEKLAENGSKRFTPEQLEAMRAAFSKIGTQCQLRIELVDDAPMPPAPLIPYPISRATASPVPDMP